MASAQQPLDGNYKPLAQNLYDSTGVQFVSPQAGTTATGTDGTVYAPQLTRLSAPYPQGATAITADSGSVAAATATATLAGTAGKTTYITGFEITATGATAASVVTATVTGVITGTLHYTYAAVAGATALCTPLLVQFPYPIPASAANTAIAVALPSLGAGNTNATVVSHGFQL